MLMVTELGRVVRSRHKIKPLYLQYHSTYGHQIWQYGDIPEGALSHYAT